MSTSVDRNRGVSRPLARYRPLARCRRRWAGLAALHILTMAAAPGAWALQILESADHGELTAEISASAVNRIALEGDRVASVIQTYSALTVEHDPVRGDVYLHADRSSRAAAEPVTLYLGSERGFTYRLTLTVAERDSAQILIRNSALAATSDERGRPHAFGSNADGRIGELVALIRAVARREPLAGYAIVAEPGRAEPGAAGRSLSAGRSPAGDDLSGPAVIETWRGPRWTARVLAHGNVFAHGKVLAHGDGLTHGQEVIEDAAAWAEAAGPGVMAAWVSAPDRPADSDSLESGSMRGMRIAVVVEATPGADR